MLRVLMLGNKRALSHGERDIGANVPVLLAGNETASPMVQKINKRKPPKRLLSFLSPIFISAFLRTAQIDSRIPM